MEDSTGVSAIEAILDKYRTKVLEPRLGQGTLTKELVQGLEEVLKTAVSGQSLPDMQFWGIDIDYGAIRRTEDEVGGKGNATRLKERFKELGLKTYGDLISYAHQAAMDGKQGVRQIFKDIRGGYGPGIATHVTLYTHLKSIGIELFSNGYNPQEIHQTFQAQDPLLDRKIDYFALKETENEVGGMGAVRLENTFGRLGLETYRDLVNYAAGRINEGGIKVTWGVRLVFRGGHPKTSGPVAHEVLYTHLNSLGIQLFPDGYRVNREIKTR